MQPTARVLDLFAVPDDVRPVPGGHGYSVVAGDLVLSPPFGWQEKFQASGHEPVSRIDEPVDPETVDALLTIPDFVRAYEVDGMTPAEFDDFGATRITLRQFLEADEELDRIVRDVILPAP